MLRAFRRWAIRVAVSRAELQDAAARLERGLIDANLGGNLYKQRIALPGRGRSGGARAIIATRFAGIAVFLYGFEKNERESVTEREIELYRGIARELLAMNENQTACALAEGVLWEVTDEPDHR
ncbi:MAG: type II toxin-antitoxin system RelE/ParE family toxin [Burkholderiales bacterium]